MVTQDFVNQSTSIHSLMVWVMTFNNFLFSSAFSTILTLERYALLSALLGIRLIISLTAPLFSKYWLILWEISSSAAIIFCNFKPKKFNRSLMLGLLFLSGSVAVLEKWPPSGFLTSPGTNAACVTCARCQGFLSLHRRMETTSCFEESYVVLVTISKTKK